MRPDPRSSFTPEQARAVLEGTFPGDMGVDFVEIGDERIVARLQVDGRHLHRGGFVHGGAWVALADSVAAFGTFRHLDAEHEFTTAELKMNVMAAATTGDELVATGTPLHVGSRTQVWEVRVTKGDRLAAVFVCTQLVTPRR